VEGADPRPAPLTEPTDDSTGLPDWAQVEPPDYDEQPEPDEPVPAAGPEPLDVAEPEPLEAVEPEPGEVIDPEPVAVVDSEPDAVLVPGPVSVMDPAPEAAAPRVSLLPIALGLVLLVLLGAVGWLFMDARDTREQDDARQAALQVARQQAVNLTTISYETADADLGRIINSATGTLKTQFEAQRAQFPGVLKKDKSVSVGTVLAAGVASQSAGTVEALVAVDAAVSNAETAKAGNRPIIKHYRMDMKLVLVGGRWLVSQVAFAGLPQ
jgi:Mce-associated membrane protein